MKKTLFYLFCFAILALSAQNADAYQTYAKDFIDDVHKYCEKKHGKRDCERACNYLGCTVDKWNVALGEKKMCIELMCEIDHDKVKRSGAIKGKRNYKVCERLCDNINDNHILCVKDKIKKYCEGNGYQESKCRKYCEKGANQHELCAGATKEKSAEKQKLATQQNDALAIDNANKPEVTEEKVSPSDNKIKNIKIPDFAEVIQAQERNQISKDNKIEESNTFGKIISSFKNVFQRFKFWR